MSGMRARRAEAPHKADLHRFEAADDFRNLRRSIDCIGLKAQAKNAWLAGKEIQVTLHARQLDKNAAAPRQ
jgi:hypothetical protein